MKRVEEVKKANNPEDNARGDSESVKPMIGPEREKAVAPTRPVFRSA